MSLAQLLPHLSNFLEVNITGDGNSGRSVSVPLDWPQALNSADLPVFINSIQNPRRTTINQLYGVFDITVVCRLYYRQVGEGLPMTAQYDIYHYADDFIQAVMDNNRLQVSGVNLPNLESEVIIQPQTNLPALLPYPPGSGNTPQYVGAVFNLSVPLRYARNC